MQEVVDEQIKKFIAPSTERLGDLAPLVQGMAQTDSVGLAPKVRNSARFAQSTDGNPCL